MTALHQAQQNLLTNKKGPESPRFRSFFVPFFLLIHTWFVVVAGSEDG